MHAMIFRFPEGEVRRQDRRAVLRRENEACFAATCRYNPSCQLPRSPRHDSSRADTTHAPSLESTSKRWWQPLKR
jgi:hypothetical protein